MFEYGNLRVAKVNQRENQNRERKRRMSLIKEGVAEKEIKNQMISDSDTDSAYGDELEFDRNSCKLIYERKKFKSTIYFF